MIGAPGGPFLSRTFVAVFWGRHDLVRFILGLGQKWLDPRQVDTALMIALSLDDVRVIQTFVESGVLPVPPPPPPPPNVPHQNSTSSDRIGIGGRDGQDGTRVRPTRDIADADEERGLCAPQTENDTPMAGVDISSTSHTPTQKSARAGELLATGDPPIRHDR